MKPLFPQKLHQALILSICSGLLISSGLAQASQPLKVVTSFYPVYVTARNILQNVPDVQVVNLTPLTTGCPHDYALTTQDIKTLANADVFVINGLGIESFYERVIQLYPHLKIIDVSEGIASIEDNHGQINPHVWVSPQLVIEQVEHLAAAIKAIDPDHANAYEQNRKNYVSRLQMLHKKMQQALAPYKGSQFITFHEAFPYFAQEFGLKIVGVVEREPGSQPNAKELAETINLIKQTGIKTIFTEPQYPSGSAETIARETNAKVYVLDPAVTGSDSSDAYINIMENNLTTLLTAFQQDK